GLNSISRQLGAVLGVAILVAIIGTPSPLEAANAFDNGWRFAAGCFLFVAVLAPFIGPIRRPEEDQPLLADRKGAGARIPAVAPRVPGVAAAEAAPPIGQRSAAEAIATVPLFSSLSDATRERLAASAHSVRVRASEWLFRQGEEADGLYVVVAGRLEAIAVDGDDENLLRILGPGSVVGELALLADTTRSASVRARRDTELLSLRRSDFEALVSEDPAFAKALLGFMGGLLQKSRALEPPPPPPAQTLALVPLSAGAPVGEVCDALLAELVHDGTAVRLDGPSGDESQGMLTGLLERYERDYNHLVLMARAPADADPWSDFCLRHADRVVAVTTRGGVPAWAAADERFAGCDLVYADVTGEGIGDWIDALAAKARHLVRPGDSLASAQAAARRIAGRSVGVVLSGGGARGFAHLGVMKELLDAGIHIDRIGGVSMGALIGGMFAQGMSFEEVDARIYEEFVRTNPLGDYRMPRHSLVRGERLRSGIVRSFDVPIEQMPRDFFAVSSDIVSGELVVHRRGSSSRAVIATVCLPGMLPPLVDGERMLVDGGVLNNLPVDVMAAAGEGPVVAADVTQRFDPWAYLREDSDGAAHNGNGRVRRARADDADDVLPGLMETVMRSLLLGSVDTAEAAREHADLVITPENDGVGLLEWHQMDRAVEAGRRAAVDALERAPAAIFA
ncbi:MAG: patatin-like phospholipase family protein, partial [Thermoleophilaceae bacterium]